MRGGWGGMTLPFRGTVDPPAPIGASLFYGRGVAVRLFEGRKGGVRGLALAPAGLLVVAAGRAHGPDAWDLATGRRLRRVPGHRRQVRLLRLSPDGTRLATADAGGTVIVWGVGPAGPRPLATAAGFADPRGLAFAPDGARLVIGGRRLWYWDWQAGTRGAWETGTSFVARLLASAGLSRARRVTA